MQFESLKVFCDVARQRSFSQAAIANEVTQSAASQIVSQLERRMGVQLIDRSTRPLQLTPFGKIYYEGCKTLLDQYMELEASVLAAHAQLAGTLQVAAIYSVGLSDMGQMVERFQSQQPGIKVQLEYLHPNRVYEKVLQGTADLGLVSFPRKSPKLATAPWREEEMVLACAPGHPLAHQPSVQITNLEGEKYIHFDKDLGIRRVVDRFLRKQGVHVEVVLEFDNIENIKKAIEIDAGVALLPEPTLRREVRGRTLVAVPLVGARLTRTLGIIHRKLPLSSAARRFIDLLCDPEAAASPRSAPKGARVNGVHPASRSPKGNHDRNGAARTSRKKV
jgi:DNA-binding transcriptional LysR family regulator